MKVVAELAEQVPLTLKFAKQNCFEIFRNTPDRLYWTQNSCFRAFRTVSLLHESRGKIGGTDVINTQVR
jgi:hypothetical protein